MLHALGILYLDLTNFHPQLILLKALPSSRFTILYQIGFLYPQLILDSIIFILIKCKVAMLKER